jgi:hypothetical protein
MTHPVGKKLLASSTLPVPALIYTGHALPRKIMAARTKGTLEMRIASIDFSAIDDGFFNLD